jgi:hypothetical protein
MKEVEGMGPEGKRYLKDKLQGKKYEGELKDKFKEDLDKELRGMSKKGKEELKKLLGLGDPFEKVREELDGKKKDKDEESIGELMAYSEKGYAKGGKVKITPEAKKIPKELEKASKMHKGQAERLKGMGFGHGGEAHYAKGGEAKPDYLDVDKDGDRKESMKKASQDKKGGRMGGPVEAPKKMKYAKGGAIHTPVKAEPKDVLRTKKLKKIMKKLKDKK